MKRTQQHIGRFATYLFVSLLGLVVVPTVGIAKAGPFTSIKQAKHYNQLVTEVRTIPDRFEWQGHEVRVWEAWLDRSGYLTFKLKIDGSEVKEHRLADKTDQHIFFRESPEWRALKADLQKAGCEGMGTFVYVPLRRIPALAFGGYGTYVHYFETVAHPLPSAIKVQMGTYSGVSKMSLSDTILTFRLEDTSH